MVDDALEVHGSELSALLIARPVRAPSSTISDWTEDVDVVALAFDCGFGFGVGGRYGALLRRIELLDGEVSPMG